MRGSTARSIAFLATLHGLSLAGIAGLSAYDPTSLPEVRAVSFAQGEEEDPASRNFQKEDEGNSWKVTYRFEDRDKVQKVMTCRILKKELDREVASFGYFNDKMWNELNRKLLQEIQQEALRLGVNDDFSIQVWGQLESQVKRVPRPSGDEGASPERIEEFNSWRKGLPERKKALRADYYLRHGFVLKEDKFLFVNYEGMASSATPALRDCFRNLDALILEKDKNDERYRQDLFLHFFQQMEYREIPADANPRDRQIQGFKAPSEVMASGSGDCDSKGTALAALWRNYPKQVLVILREDKKHALVGLEGHPRPDLPSVLLKNRYYSVGEVVAAKNRPPGVVEFKGKNPWYVCIRPEGQSKSVSCP